jgi:predicted nucleic acid-binding Zn ribbon protein
MSTTLLRLGLWTLILVMVLYVLTTTYSEEPWAELIPMQMLQQALVLAGVVIVAGIVLRVLGVGARVVSKNRCRICRTPIASGAIYCREHLRNILAQEDEKTHMTRVRR